MTDTQENRINLADNSNLESSEMSDKVEDIKQQAAGEEEQAEQPQKSGESGSRFSVYVC